MTKEWIIIALSCWLALPEPAFADTNEKLLGNRSDGSRAPSIHLISLYPENEDGQKGPKITPDDQPLLPFSTRWTCGSCHSYATISKGWHFNAVDPNINPGRPGQPWILVDASTGTQIPLSYRPWPGTFKPQQLGLTPREFVKLFGSHTPGGGPGELQAQNPHEFIRQYISGKLEINCLACHNANPGQNQGQVGGYALHIARENFRWAAAASSEFASVTGSAGYMPDTYDPFMPEPLKDPRKKPPAVTYRKNVFDSKNRVFFDIVRKVPDRRCYYCHSHLDIGENSPQRWAADEDVHLMAGLTCVDCHREGIEHITIRGYQGEDAVSKNPAAAASTCAGCHNQGRLGAPVPQHPGLPTVHLDKLTCTACHSGPWPHQKTGLTKTSRAHRLGTIGSNKSPQALPHIISPLFATQEGIDIAYPSGLWLLSLDGKIAPHKLIWPAFWASMKDGKVTPIALEQVRQAVGKILAREILPPRGDWPSFTSELITEALNSLQKTIKAKAVYISAGKLHHLDDQGSLTASEHHAARPYLWPFAHNVRPAPQALGIHGCKDCHSTDAPFFFGKVALDSPIVTERNALKEMIDFQNIKRFYARAFAFSFVFRPWLKIIALCCCALLAAVLLLYALKALACVVKVLTEKNIKSH